MTGTLEHLHGGRSGNEVKSLYLISHPKQFTPLFPFKSFSQLCLVYIFSFSCNTLIPVVVQTKLYIVQSENEWLTGNLPVFPAACLLPGVNLRALMWRQWSGVCFVCLPFVLFMPCTIFRQEFINRQLMDSRNLMHNWFRMKLWGPLTGYFVSGIKGNQG